MSSMIASHSERNSEWGSRPMAKLAISRPRRCSRWNGVSRMTLLSLSRSSSRTFFASSGRRPWRRA
eukprot:2107788-Alexandrium_andersonii.AAC.1